MKTKSTDANKGASRLQALTGLRFLAALLVVVHHWQINWPLAPVSKGLDVADSLKRIGHNIAFSGYVGVNFFFMLSGFILAYNYLDIRKRQPVSKQQFWIARIARIYPVYFVAFFFAAPPYFHRHQLAPVAACSGHSSVETGLAALTLVQAWLPCSANFWNPPGWSLSVEAFFYLLFPFIGLYAAKLSRRQLFSSLGLLWIVTLAAPVAYMVLNIGGSRYAWSAQQVLDFNPLLRLPEFLMGVALGRLFLLGNSEHARQSKRYSARAVNPQLLGGIALISIIGVLSYGTYLPYALLHNGLIDPLFALLLYSLACGRGPLAALFSLPAAVLLGEASYALYLVHFPLWGWMSYVVTRLHAVNQQSPLYFLFYLAIAISLSLFSLRFIEQPARRAIKSALARHIPQGTPAAELRKSDIQPQPIAHRIN